MESISVDAADIVRLFVTCNAIDCEVFNVMNVHKLLLQNLHDLLGRRLRPIRESCTRIRGRGFADEALASRKLPERFLAASWAFLGVAFEEGS